jgi:hypothetical protein
MLNHHKISLGRLPSSCIIFLVAQIEADPPWAELFTYTSIPTGPRRFLRLSSKYRGHHLPSSNDEYMLTEAVAESNLTWVCVINTRASSV